MGSVLTARAKVEGLSTNQALLGQQVSQYREAAQQARVIEKNLSRLYKEIYTVSEKKSIIPK
jgi:hypothetical protein